MKLKLLLFLIFCTAVFTQTTPPPTNPNSPPEVVCNITLCTKCITPTQCQTCDTFAAVVGNNCECIHGYSINALSNKCEECKIDNCLSCNPNNFSQCLSCGQNYVLNEVTKQCDCGTGYFRANPADKECQACHKSCDQCAGLLATDCTKCQASAAKFVPISETATVGTCECDFGYFPNANRFFPNTTTIPHKIQDSCIPCPDRNCLACGTNGICVECRPSFHLENNFCVCTPGFYANHDTKQCEACLDGCTSCSGLTSCHKCAHFSSQIVNGVCNCPDGTYKDATTKKCLPCHKDCLTCSGPNANECHSCPHFRKSFDWASGKCVCNQGFYEDFNGHCRICHVSCSSCTGPLSTHCTSCMSQQQLNVIETIKGRNVGKCVCSAGQYTSGDSTCENCNSNCLTCHGPTDKDCITCRSNVFTIRSDGSCGCPAGTVIDYYTPPQEAGQPQQPPYTRCANCSQYCDECHSPTQCATCATGFTLFDNHCICASGTYLDETVGKCISCGDQCQTCDPISHKCMTCVPGAVQNDDKSCSCASTTPLYLSSSRSCSAACAADHIYSPRSQDCVKALCGINCMNCTNNKCHKCHSGFRLIHGECQTVCKDGQYHDGATGTCMNCSSDCVTCTDSKDKCTSCHEDFLLSFEHHKCYQPLNCDAGTYFSHHTLQCMKCHNVCGTCKGPESRDCLSCRPNRLFVDKQCLECKDVKGWTLNHTSNACEPKCGDGVRLPGEECDDGNTQSLDGCSDQCKVETHWGCFKSDTGDKCFLRPTVKAIFDEADPYNIVVTFDKDMNEDNQCDLDVYLSNMKIDEYAVSIKRKTPTECLVHIDYGKTLMNESIFLVFHNYSLVKDTIDLSLEATSEQMLVKLDGYIFSKQQKEETLKATYLTSNGFLWLTYTAIVCSVALLIVKSGFLIWNLIDFVQKLGLISLLDLYIPFHLEKFLDVGRFFLLRIDTSDYLPWTDIKFFEYIWPLVIVVLLGEILNLGFTIACLFVNISRETQDSFCSSVRLRILSIITIPLFIILFDSLNPFSANMDTVSLVLATCTAGLYLGVVIAMIKDLTGEFDTRSEKIPEQYDLVMRYRAFLEEVNFTESHGRTSFPVTLLIRVLLCSVVSYIGGIDKRIQVLLMLTLEFVQLFTAAKFALLCDRNLRYLQILQSIVIIGCISGATYINYNVVATDNIQLSWVIQAVTLLTLVIIFAFNVNRFMTRLALKVQTQLDILIFKWVQAVQSIELQGMTTDDRNEEKPDKVDFQIINEEEEAN